MKIDIVKLSLWMDEAGFNDSELARECEVSTTCIRLIRVGESEGTLKLIGLIADVLDVPTTYITKD
jgi:hypothetical protein